MKIKLNDQHRLNKVVDWALQIEVASNVDRKHELDKEFQRKRDAGEALRRESRYRDHGVYSVREVSDILARHCDLDYNQVKHALKKRSHELVKAGMAKAIDKGYECVTPSARYVDKALRAVDGGLSYDRINEVILEDQLEELFIGY